MVLSYSNGVQYETTLYPGFGFFRAVLQFPYPSCRLRPDIAYRGETYYWSKHHEFLKFIDVLQRVHESIELATGLSKLPPADRYMLESYGWRLTDTLLFRAYNPQRRQNDIN